MQFTSCAKGRLSLCLALIRIMAASLHLHLAQAEVSMIYYIVTAWRRKSLLRVLVHIRKTIKHISRLKSVDLTPGPSAAEEGTRCV